MTAELKPITGVRESAEDLNGSVTEYSYVTPDEETMRELSRLLFEERWREIIVGPCIEGAVFEIRFEQASKKVSYLDGYLTVDLGYWRFHLCIDKHKGTRSAELAAKRQVAKLAFFLVFGAGSIVGMVIMSCLVGLPTRLMAARFLRLNLAVRALAGLFSIGFGIWLLPELTAA